jgi:hypothetical protein
MAKRTITYWWPEHRWANRETTGSFELQNLREDPRNDQVGLIVSHL